MKIKVLIVSLLLSACATHQARKPSSSEPSDPATQRIQALAQSETVKAAVLEFANSVTFNGQAPPFWQLVTHTGSSQALVKRVEKADRLLAKESNTELRAFLQKLESLGLPVIPNHPDGEEPWQIALVSFSYWDRSLSITIRVTPTVNLVYELPVSERGYASANEFHITNYSGKKNQF